MCHVDYPSIRAISGFIANTKYPGGLPTATAEAAPAARLRVGPGLSVAAAEAAVSTAVALTGFQVRAAKICNLLQLYSQMQNGTELHSLAPYTR